MGTPRNLFLIFWRLGSPNSRCQQGKFHFEAPSLDLRTVAVCLHVHLTSSLYVQGGKERERDFSGVSSYKAANPVISGLNSYDHLILITSLFISTLGIRALPYELVWGCWRGTQFNP